MNETLIDGVATFKHLNIRKEGPADEKILAIDLKLAGCECDLNLLKRLLGAHNTTEVKQTFWDRQGDMRFGGLAQPIGSGAEIENCHVTIDHLRLPGALIRKFKVTIGGNHTATVDFAISLKDPPSDATPILAELVSDEVRVSIAERQRELFVVSHEEDYP